MIASPHFDHGISGYLLARLFDPRLLYEHQPCHDQRLCPRATLRLAAFDEQLVDPFLSALALHHGTARYAYGTEHATPLL